MLHMFRIRFHRKQEQKSRMTRNKVKILHITGVRNHISIKIVLKLPNAVNIHPRCPTILEQLLLIMHPMLSKELHRVICIDTPLFHRDRCVPKFLHMYFH